MQSASTLKDHTGVSAAVASLEMEEMCAMVGGVGYHFDKIYITIILL